MLGAVVFVILYLPLGVMFALTKKYRQARLKEGF